ncbi:MAG: hypothetical protein Q8R04_04395 [Nanoarchaeota archaeon]|nr:hypothetical protein [Nanoarchaeota archaeon]
MPVVKRIMLSMADELFAALEKKRKTRGYMTTQELINDILRRNLFIVEKQNIVEEQKKKSKAGRPPKVDEPFLEYFSRKR